MFFGFRRAADACLLRRGGSLRLFNPSGRVRGGRVVAVRDRSDGTECAV